MNHVNNSLCSFLQISKTLVDLQLENNRIQEETEAAKFELTNKVHWTICSSLSLYLRNLIVQLEAVFYVTLVIC